MKTKIQYITPIVKVVAFNIEIGFSSSNPSRLALFNETNSSGYNDQGQENWSTGNFEFSWGDDD